MNRERVREAIDEVKRGLEFGVSCGKDSTWKWKNAIKILVEFADRIIAEEGEEQPIRNKMKDDWEKLYERIIGMRCKCGRKINRSKKGITYKECLECRKLKEKRIRQERL